ncbi:hypothetical protein SM0020_33418 [Sinorhizobium meliloti CCNWSX0020]|uniref:Uncharacterized protein n=1 Tax=Sinorhizobium meliloti CCNWSX0020 TaxID=1107881 RepID=H0GAX1_RHIML|nr:hypothetical protein SM0020_33418 [Sinorhizobium meliloti CCNWSX0020]
MKTNWEDLSATTIYTRRFLRRRFVSKKIGAPDAAGRATGKTVSMSRAANKGGSTRL